MGRRQNEMGGNSSRWHPLLLLLVAFITSSLVYMCFSVALHRPMGAYSSLSSVNYDSESALELERGEEGEECCGGVENLELWGSSVKWGSDFKFNSSKDCCKACKAMCGAGDGPCLCDSWVFCGDREKCMTKFGECWLKKQKDVLLPEVQDSGERVIWTSGIIFGKGEGIVGLETEHGTLHIKLFPECAPYSVAYIVELLKWRHCPGCQFYRAEHRGNSWDSEGNHIADASLGPPYGLIQGTLEAEAIPFKEIPVEACPTIQRGSVAWVGRGPEFFISLANHNEWRGAYTVFGAVLPEDMVVAEKIAHLPTKSDVWNNINVTILREPVGLKLRRITKSDGDLNLNADNKLGSSVS